MDKLKASPPPVYPHPNSQNLWICSSTWQGGIKVPDGIKMALTSYPEMERWAWIIQCDFTRVIISERGRQESQSQSETTRERQILPRGLSEGAQPCLHLRHISDFWPPELEDNKFMLLQVTNFVVIFIATTGNEHILPQHLNRRKFWI